MNQFFVTSENSKSERFSFVKESGLGFEDGPDGCEGGETEGAFVDDQEDCGGADFEEALEDGTEDCEGVETEEDDMFFVVAIEENSSSSLASMHFMLLELFVIMARILQEQSVGLIGEGGMGSEEKELDPTDSDEEEFGRGKYLLIMSFFCLSSNSFIFSE